MPFGVLSGVPDIITHAKFYVHRTFYVPQKVAFPILIRTILTTVHLHYRADCDMNVALSYINVSV